MGRYEITGGKIPHAKKVLVYGPEGVGKSTFASKFPDPLFIDTEGSTRNLDVKRMPTPTSKGWQGIEDAGYGKGYTYLAERFGQLFNRLEDVIQVGINVVVTAHAKISKFEQPDEMGTYDRWELKLEKKTAPMAKEWADMILFANYQTIVIKSKDGKSKGQGGQKRVMYTTHTATWDAKNRDDLPDKLDFDYNQIAHLFADATISKMETTQPVEKDPLPYEETKPIDIRDGMDQETSQIVDPEDLPKEIYKGPEYQGIPQALIDLMRPKMVKEDMVRKAVAARGYFPEDMPIKDYPIDFINGVLIGAWDQVYQMIKDQLELPF